MTGLDPSPWSLPSNEQHEATVILSLLPPPSFLVKGILIVWDYLRLAYLPTDHAVFGSDDNSMSGKSLATTHASP